MYICYIVGGRVRLDGELVEKQVYCCNYSREEDLVQAPVMIEYKGERYIYTQHGINMCQNERTEESLSGKKIPC